MQMHQSGLHICKCMQELGPAYVLAYRRSRCMAFLHGICMGFAWYLHGFCSAWVVTGPPLNIVHELLLTQFEVAGSIFAITRGPEAHLDSGNGTN